MRFASLVPKAFIALSASVCALPSSPIHQPSKQNLNLLNGLTLTSPQRTNSTSLNLSDNWPILCYHNPGQPLVDLAICNPLAHILASEPGFRVAKIFSPGIGTLRWSNRGCTIFIQPGHFVSLFSMSDVLLEVESILHKCQPTRNPNYTGNGGQAPINAPPELSAQAFLIQVVGSA